MKLTLSADAMRTLSEKAAAHGMSIEQYALQLLERDLAPAWLCASWASAEASGLDQLSMDEIDAEIDATRRARASGNFNASSKLDQ